MSGPGGQRRAPAKLPPGTYHESCAGCKLELPSILKCERCLDPENRRRTSSLDLARCDGAEANIFNDRGRLACGGQQASAEPIPPGDRSRRPGSSSRAGPGAGPDSRDGFGSSSELPSWQGAALVTTLLAAAIAWLVWKLASWARERRQTSRAAAAALQRVASKDNKQLLAAAESRLAAARESQQRRIELEGIRHHDSPGIRWTARSVSLKPVPTHGVTIMALEVPCVHRWIKIRRPKPVE